MAENSRIKLSPLGPALADWFARQGWTPFPHQLAMMQLAARGQSGLLVAPTGGGKTLAGFLPSLNALAARPMPAKAKTLLHTLYISPLKALTADVGRNLERPVVEAGLPVRIDIRTGDTTASERAKQRRQAPDILLTTPESFALLLSYREAATYFGTLETVIIDELHAIAESKRGQLLSLGLAQLAGLAPRARFVGLSATVAEPAAMADFLSFRGQKVKVVRGADGPAPRISVLHSGARVPWGGRMGQHAVKDVYEAIRTHRVTLVFVNTRAQAELAFQGLWRCNDENLPIGLHHGSLAVAQRRRIELAMADGKLRAVVCTSSLDLGIDWGDVDLVVQLGAPKGASRLLQRIGRSNHRFDEPSEALLVPANRFELLECRAAMEAVAARELDPTPQMPPSLDVLAQHILGMACAAPIYPDALFAAVRRAQSYRNLPREDFDQTLAFVAHGGYALRAYERYHRLSELPDGSLTIAAPAVARQYRLNVGTIVEATMLRVRLGRSRVLGDVEEWFVQGLTPGDTFMFAGRLLRYEGIEGLHVVCSAARSGTPKVPSYAGGRMPMSANLANRVREILANPARQRDLPEDVRDWLREQRLRSVLPSNQGLLVESFPRDKRQYLVLYSFEGRNAHQTLGMLSTRRMERAGLRPLGFVATDYALGIWSLKRPSEGELAALLSEDMLGDDLEEWMDESSMLKRSFRNVAVITGLIDRRHPGAEKSRKQVTFNADLIYEVLRRHEPRHILLRATRQDAAWNLADVVRLAGFLKRIQGAIIYRELKQVSPLAIPLLLTIGRERVEGEALDLLLQEEGEAMMAEAIAR
jgi:ATP-dependent Lhr-like helicase